jgi:peptide-methionine (S)-S-oxide reductase
MLMRLFGRDKTAMVEPAAALPGRSQAMAVPARHEVLGTPLQPPFPDGVETAIFGMGCFWGAEKLFWQAEGVYTTAVGYAGGVTPNPTYQEACSCQTGHAEVVLVAYDTAITGYGEMLRLFWEGHDPTQGMRQGNDLGTQYRSLLMWRGEGQRTAAEASLVAYQQMLSATGHGPITTELAEADTAHPFYYAEDYHQQYLAKNVGGYDCSGGLGVACPVGLNVSAPPTGRA